jgi:hypothetical protein
VDAFKARQTLEDLSKDYDMLTSVFLQTLEHFSKDYDPTNPEHVLMIPLGKTHYSAFKVL